MKKPITLKEYDRLANKLISITDQKKYLNSVMDSLKASSKIGEKGEGSITGEFFKTIYDLRIINREITRISNILNDVNIESLRKNTNN